MKVQCKIKKIISIMIVGILLCGTFYIPSFGTTDFPDMSKHWSKQYVNLLVDKGVITGYKDGTFKPDQSVTRAEFISLLLKATDQDANVKSGNWSSGIINKAINLGLITEGDKLNLKDVFERYPTKKISRQEMALVLTRVCDLILGQTNQDSIEIQEYIKDYNLVGNSYKEYVAEAYALGLLQGDNYGFFNPLSTCTRAEASTVICKLIDVNMRPKANKFEKTLLLEEDINAVTPKSNVQQNEIEYMSASDFIKKYRMKLAYDYDETIGASYHILLRCAQYEISTIYFMSKGESMKEGMRRFGFTQSTLIDEQYDEEGRLYYSAYYDAVFDKPDRDALKNCDSWMIYYNGKDCDKKIIVVVGNPFNEVNIITLKELYNSTHN